LTETGSNRVRRVDEQKRINRVKLGDTLSYRGGEGTVVHRSNEYVKLADNESHIVTTVPVSETYYREDIIGDGNIQAKMWDLMQRDQRSALLNKHNILGDTQKAYLYRDWNDVPTQVQEILKLETAYDSGAGTSHGGVEGREPDFSGRNEESRSHRDLTEPHHVIAPYETKQAPAFNKSEEEKVGAKFAKSDVEHGVYGGVVTDTPIDATDEYEDKRPKKPLSGAQTAINEGPSGQTGTKRTVGNEPSDPTKSPGIHERWSETRKDLDLASITGEGDKEDKDKFHDEKEKQTHEPSTTPEALAGTTKDGDRGVGQDSAGWQGAKPNAQAAEKTETDMTAITGEPNKKKEEGGTSGTTNAVHGDGPQHLADKSEREREVSIINKGNTRWGLRQASKEDIEAFYAKQ